MRENDAISGVLDARMYACKWAHNTENNTDNIWLWDYKENKEHIYIVANKIKWSGEEWLK